MAWVIDPLVGAGGGAATNEYTYTPESGPDYIVEPGTSGGTTRVNYANLAVVLDFEQTYNFRVTGDRIIEIPSCRKLVTKETLHGVFGDAVFWVGNAYEVIYLSPAYVTNVYDPTRGFFTGRNADTRPDTTELTGIAAEDATISNLVGGRDQTKYGTLSDAQQAAISREAYLKANGNPNLESGTFAEGNTYSLPLLDVPIDLSPVSGTSETPFFEVYLYNYHVYGEPGAPLAGAYNVIRIARWIYETSPSGNGGGNGGGEPPAPPGEPPQTQPMPETVPPAGGGCKSSMNGAASCNWTVSPPDQVPKPGDNYEPPGYPPMPIVQVHLPTMPPIGCRLPNFGNMEDCPPMPGTGSPLPGGRHRSGSFAKGNHIGIKTGGKLHGKRKKQFRTKRCFPAGQSHMGAITELLTETGVSPVDIVFQIGPEWDKTLRREKCFKRGVSKLDAAEWFASRLMCRIIDEGPPTDNVYIGPPHHRPGQVTWEFDEHFDLFGVARGSSSSESYYAVEVFGDHLSGSVISLVESPFATPDDEVLQIEVGPDYTRGEAQALAAFRAGLLRRESTSVQATVPYSEEYMLRDKMILRAPDRGFQETYLIYGKQSDISIDGRIHVLTGVLPATAREMEEFPKVKV